MGSRGVANLAYTYRLRGRIDTAVDELEERASQQKRTATRDERKEVITQVVSDFDLELETEDEPDRGVTAERVIRARENARALEGLMQMMGDANAADVAE